MNEELPKPRPAGFLGENLEGLSIAELANRIVLLRNEVARTERMIEEKQKAQSAALAAFKSPPAP